MIQKTLGGERLGSGSKMKVELHGYERSTHDLGYLFRSTMSAGTLVPFLCEVALPGDTFDINLNCDVKTHPTIGPLFGSFKVQLDVFQAPLRLYNALLHNNALNIGRQMSQVKLPQIELTAQPTADNVLDVDNSQVNPSCLLAYLGIRGVGMTETPDAVRSFNAVPILAYWEIYKNYYSNKQEEIGAVLHTPQTVINETVTELNWNGFPVPQAPTTNTYSAYNNDQISVHFTGAVPTPETIMVNTLEYGNIALSQLSNNFTQNPGQLVAWYNNTTYGQITIINWDYRNQGDVDYSMPKVQMFTLEQIDMMRNAVLAYQSTTVPFKLNDQSTLTPYKWLYEASNGINNRLSSQEGLALKTYQSDIFNNWLSTEWIDGANGISEITAVDVSGGTLKIDALNLSKKVYDMLNRIAVSGGTYDDWLDAVYTHDRLQRAESPIYHGGLIKELVFQEVVSNSATAGGSSTATGQPLGTLAGKGIMAQKHKGGNVIIKVDEPSYLIGLVSLTPRIDYSQGNKWDVHLKTMDDLHKPALDEIGFQELIVENMAWWDTRYSDGVWNTHSAGKQPAWINYMTNFNRVYGNFAVPTNEMFMTLNRRYEFDGTTIGDLTTYIDPAKFNNIFAETARDAQNFWTQISVDITARRKMSAKVMPNL